MMHIAICGNLTGTRTLSPTKERSIRRCPNLPILGRLPDNSQVQEHISKIDSEMTLDLRSSRVSNQLQEITPSSST